MSQTDKLNNFMSRVVQNTESILIANDIAQNLRDEYTRLGLDAATLDAILAETPESDNNHLTGAIVVAYMTSVDALGAYMDAGHGTNLYKVKR